MDGKKHYQGHRQRLRERFRREPRSLADYELLELLLGYVLQRRDTKPLAKELLDRCGSLSGVFAARGEELRTVDGFGPALETFWDLWRETRARASEIAPAGKRTLESPQAVADMAVARLGAQRLEEFWIALVDAGNRLLAWEQAGKGTVDQVQVYVREVIALALGAGASGIILVHNHPGGGLEPSGADLALTRRMHEAARTMGLRLLDHLIVAGDAFYSFQEHGLMDE